MSIGVVIGLAALLAILVVWYIAEHVFDSAFDSVWSAIARLFRREPTASTSENAPSKGTTGLMMPRQDNDESSAPDV